MCYMILMIEISDFIQNKELFNHIDLYVHMEEPKDLMVLGAIIRGKKKFDNIVKATNIDPKEIDSILAKLDERGFIRVNEKKGWLGTKIEITVTESGRNEIESRVHEMQSRWMQMTQAYKTEDKEKMRGWMDDNKSFIPMMIFFGVIDMMMFSMMFSMMGMTMSDYVPAESMPETDMGGDEGGDMGGDGFDLDIGF